MAKPSPSAHYPVTGCKKILYSLILDKIKDKSDLRVLDIGCKKGEDLFYLSCKKPQIRAYGLDLFFSKDGINYKESNCHFIQGDGASLPFKDSCFDIIIAAEIIEHLTDVDNFLAEVYRVLRPGGHFFVTTPPRYNYTALIGKLVPKRLKPSLRQLVYYGTSKTDGIKAILPGGKIVREHVREYIPQELKVLFKRHGLTVESVRAGCLQVPIAPLFDRIPLLLKVWKISDRSISKLPFSIYIKANFIMSAQKRELNLKEFKKILVVNLGGIGDILLSTPALRALKDNFPKTEISILVVPRVCDIAEDLPYIDKIYVFYPGYNPISLFKDFSILAGLRRRHFDLLINMRTIVSKIGAAKIKLLLDIVNPKIKAGRDTNGWAKFFDIKTPETLVGQKYEMEYDIDMVRAIGAEVIGRNIDFKIDPQTIDRVDGILENKGIGKNDILIGIHLGGRSCRRWPIKNFAEVVDRISKKIPCKFMLTGDESESDLAKKLIEIANLKMINLCGKSTIKELGALIKRCNLYISNDTGPMHIAAIIKTPLVAIFVSGDFLRYDPGKISDKTIVLYKRVDCAPCNKVNCASMKCLKAISPDAVVQAGMSLLRRG